ncbi:MAG: hypothetical protein U1E76_13795 [Planctomycetota bacterium]
MHTGEHRLQGKAIAVEELAGASLTTIVGGLPAPWSRAHPEAGALSVLDGATITHGAVAGGIWCAQSAPTLIDNIITANSADAYGGAITCLDASPFIGSNHISGNSTFGSGGAIHCVRSRAVIEQQCALLGELGLPGQRRRRRRAAAEFVAPAP